MYARENVCLSVSTYVWKYVYATCMACLSVCRSAPSSSSRSFLLLAQLSQAPQFHGVSQAPPTERKYSYSWGRRAPFPSFSPPLCYRRATREESPRGARAAYRHIYIHSNTHTHTHTHIHTHTYTHTHTFRSAVEQTRGPRTCIHTDITRMHTAARGKE